MIWFQGEIPAGIQMAKNKGFIFLVYVTGIDDISKKMDETWQDSNVSKLIEDNCVALRLEAKSEACVQFSQIYPVVCIPSTYFIGDNGVPIEIIGGHVEAQDFVKKIEATVEVFKGGQTKTSPTVPKETSEVLEPNSTDSSAAVETSQNTENSQGPTEEILETPPDSGITTETSGEMEISKNTEPSGDTEMPESKEQSGATETTPEMSKEEKLKRAEELIAMKREERGKEAQEKERNEEEQRRRLGKETAKLRQWQEEKEREEMAQSWKKEKEEARLAKERVRAQIARDREERSAKFQKEKQERQMELDKKKQMKEEVSKQAQEKAEAAKRETSRIQFRLPDGSNITETFASSETLGTAKIFLKAKVGNSYGNFGLMTTYPKREFTEEDMIQSLLDLDLCPSAALVVIPGGHKSSTSKGDNSSDGGILMLILSPLILLWNFLYNLLFGAPAQPHVTNPQGESSSANSASQSSSQNKHGDVSQSSNATRNRSNMSQGLSSRQEGNIRRFTANDDDDDMAVYNGNSTQQM